MLDASDFTGDADTVLLLVSEVVTNAIRHAATPFDLTITVEGSKVTVSVVDHDRDHAPEIQDPGPTDTSGRGLLIVDTLATSWGYETVGGDTKSVWFSLVS